MHTRIRVANSVIIDRQDDFYISFPDVVQTADGRLLCAYRQADIHFPPNPHVTNLVLQESYDLGKTWTNKRVFPHKPRDNTFWSWHCARMSRMKDGRIALLCDLAPQKFKNHTPVVYLCFSENNGSTWNDPIDTGITGIMPDRLIEFEPDTWGTTTHWFYDHTHRYYSQRFYITTNAGKTWSLQGIVADNSSAKQSFVEASIVVLSDNSLLAFLRENSFLHFPTYVTRSTDQGKTWSTPMPHPTHGHRHSAGLIDKDTLLVTYRNVGGNPGLFAWTGQTKETGYVLSGKDLSGQGVSLTADVLKIQTSGNAKEGVEYVLPPLLDWNSDASLAARVSCTEGQENSCVLRLGGTLRILPGYITYSAIVHENKQLKTLVLGKHECNTNDFHDYEIRLSGKQVAVYVDSQKAFTATLPEHQSKWDRKSAFGNYSSPPNLKIVFSNHAGNNNWQCVNYFLKQSTGETFLWSWNADSKKLPNQYETTRSFRLDSENSGVLMDANYSGWIPLGKDKAYCVDYRKGDASNPYIVGHELEVF